MPVQHFCSILKSTKDRAIEGGGKSNTPILTSFALNVYDVYIEFNHGVELKAKSPPLIWLFYVLAIEIIVDGISCYPAHINSGIM